MTPEQIDKLDGRELDAAVAVALGIPALPFSTDLADAWMAFLAMPEPTWDTVTVAPGTRFFRSLAENAAGQWVAGWIFVDSASKARWHGRTTAIAPSAPICICRAFLRCHYGAKAVAP